MNVTPVKAGVHASLQYNHALAWIPTFVGMTVFLGQYFYVAV
jgi:hypothetical protein